MKYALCRKGNSWMATPNIKRILRPVLVLTAALYTLALCAGCSRLPEVTLDQLMDQVNAAHQAVNNDGLIEKFIPRQPVDENGELISESERFSYYVNTAEADSYDPDLVLTRQQMEEDVVYLFDALYACYGNYDKMGGQAAFDAAEQAILEECGQVDSLRAAEFQELLLSHLSFVKDAHFQIQNQSPNPLWYPFFFREVAFYLDEDQYITADHKKVASVDGYDDLTQLFKRSISPEGEIVYYPVVLQDTITWDEPLIIHYTDGTAQVLQPEPYQEVPILNQSAIPELRNNNGIPILQVNGMRNNSVPGWSEAFLEGAKTLGNSKIGILDLRFNSGGDQDLIADWLKTYAKTSVPSNSLFLDAFTGEQMLNARDLWVQNDNFLVILTSKHTASGSEWLIDSAHNLENVLFVGENTFGCLVGCSVAVHLKNSKFVAKIGTYENIIPSTNDYFEEYRGFYPDLWVPADEAEDLVLALLARQAKDPA